jgi:hypothetical protein
MSSELSFIQMWTSCCHRDSVRTQYLLWGARIIILLLDQHLRLAMGCQSDWKLSLLLLKSNISSSNVSTMDILLYMVQQPKSFSVRIHPKSKKITFFATEFQLLNYSCILASSTILSQMVCLCSWNNSSFDDWAWCPVYWPHQRSGNHTNFH